MISQILRAHRPITKSRRPGSLTVLMHNHCVYSAHLEAVTHGQHPSKPAQ